MYSISIKAVRGNNDFVASWVLDKVSSGAYASLRLKEINDTIASCLDDPCASGGIAEFIRLISNAPDNKNLHFFATLA